jgi:hypothetical protein
MHTQQIFSPLVVSNTQFVVKGKLVISSSQNFLFITVSNVDSAIPNVAASETLNQLELKCPFFLIRDLSSPLAYS